MATFDLELVSPERLLLSRPVEMAVIPAVEGDMGVLPNHSPMIVALKGGVIRVTEGGRETERLFIMGGFAEITPNRVTVLADEHDLPFPQIRNDADRRSVLDPALSNHLAVRKADFIFVETENGPSVNESGWAAAPVAHVPALTFGRRERARGIHRGARRK